MDRDTFKPKEDNCQQGITFHCRRCK